MNVKSILDEKGREVETISSRHTLLDVVDLLAEKRIGAVVVTEGNDVIKGIISERDIVKLLGRNGADALGLPVDQAMTKSVKVCGEDHTIDEVMEIMTTGRFRHLPVETNGKLSGIISIGDVVKRRIEDVEREAEEIRSYITSI